MNSLPDKLLVEVDPDANVDLTGITQVSVWEPGDTEVKIVLVEVKNEEGIQKIYAKS